MNKSVLALGALLAASGSVQAQTPDSSNVTGEMYIPKHIIEATPDLIQGIWAFTQLKMRKCLGKRANVADIQPCSQQTQRELAELRRKVDGICEANTKPEDHVACELYGMRIAVRSELLKLMETKKPKREYKA